MQKVQLLHAKDGVVGEDGGGEGERGDITMVSASQEPSLIGR